MEQSEVASLLARARDLASEERFEEAVLRLDEALDLDPGSEEARDLSGELHGLLQPSRRRLAELQQILQKAIEEDRPGEANWAFDEVKKIDADDQPALKLSQMMESAVATEPPSEILEQLPAADSEQQAIRKEKLRLQLMDSKKRAEERASAEKPPPEESAPAAEAEPERDEAAPPPTVAPPRPGTEPSAERAGTGAGSASSGAVPAATTTEPPPAAPPGPPSPPPTEPAEQTETRPSPKAEIPAAPTRPEDEAPEETSLPSPAGERQEEPPTQDTPWWKKLLGLLSLFLLATLILHLLGFPLAPDLEKLAGWIGLAETEVEETDPDPPPPITDPTDDIDPTDETTDPPDDPTDPPAETTEPDPPFVETDPPDGPRSLRQPLIHAGSGVVFLEIAAGEFSMGCATDFDAECDPDELPPHRVVLPRPFSLARTETTNRQYKWCMDRGLCAEPQEGTATLDDDSRPSHPVSGVSHRQATGFCAAIEARLPTEAEWEYAARGGIARQVYPWGNRPPTCLEGPSNGAQFDDDLHCDNLYPAPVASYSANGYGLFDLAGNVREWVADRYSSAWYGSSPVEAPTGPRTGRHFVTRGGSSFSSASGLRVSNRHRMLEDRTSVDIGFRCARD